MDPSERPEIWSADDVVQRRQQTLRTLFDDNHPMYVDAQELFTPPLPREMVTQLLFDTFETYGEIRAIARELRYLDSIVKNDKKGRRKRHPRLHEAHKYLKARLKFLENLAGQTLPFTFNTQSAGRLFAAGEGIVADLIDPIPDDLVDEMFPPILVLSPTSGLKCN